MSNRKPINYWKDWKNVEYELRKIIEEIGQFPTQQDLIELNRGDLIGATTRHHGGLIKVGKDMGYSHVKRSSGYYTSENIKKEIRAIVQEIGHFPSHAELKNLGKTTLSNYLTKYGTSKMKEEFDIEENRKPDNYWKKWEYVEGKLIEIIEEIGHFPTVTELRSRGNDDLYSAMIRHHGGSRKIRSKMGYGAIIREPNYWKDLGAVLNEASEIITEHGFDELPSQKILGELGHSSLSVAISKYHGGRSEFCDRLNEYVGKRSEKDQVESLLEKYIGEVI